MTISTSNQPRTDHSPPTPVSCSPNRQSQSASLSAGKLRIVELPSPTYELVNQNEWNHLSDADFAELEPLGRSSHGVMVDAETVDMSLFVSIPSENMDQYQLSVKDGKLHLRDSLIHRTPVSGFIYVMSKEKEIYIIPPVLRSIFHSSLGKNCDVIAAGTIKIEDGIPLEITDDSGHYKPHDRSKFAIKTLQQKGCNTEDCKVKKSRFAPLLPQEREARQAQTLDAILKMKSPTSKEEEKMTASPKQISPSLKAKEKCSPKQRLTPISPTNPKAIAMKYSQDMMAYALTPPIQSPLKVSNLRSLDLF